MQQADCPLRCRSQGIDSFLLEKRRCLSEMDAAFSYFQTLVLGHEALPRISRASGGPCPHTPQLFTLGIFVQYFPRAYFRVALAREQLIHRRALLSCCDDCGSTKDDFLLCSLLRHEEAAGVWAKRDRQLASEECRNLLGIAFGVAEANSQTSSQRNRESPASARNHAPGMERAFRVSAPAVKAMRVQLVLLD